MSLVSSAAGRLKPKKGTLIVTQTGGGEGGRKEYTCVTLVAWEGERRLILLQWPLVPASWLVWEGVREWGGAGDSFF